METHTPSKKILHLNYIGLNLNQIKMIPFEINRILVCLKAAFFILYYIYIPHIVMSVVFSERWRLTPLVKKKILQLNHIGLNLNQIKMNHVELYRIRACNTGTICLYCIIYAIYCDVCGIFLKWVNHISSKKSLQLNHIGLAPNQIKMNHVEMYRIIACLAELLFVFYHVYLILSCVFIFWKMEAHTPSKKDSPTDSYMTWAWVKSKWIMKCIEWWLVIKVPFFL